MPNSSYHFKVDKPEDVDFPRILRENEGENFVLVDNPYTGPWAHELILFVSYSFSERFKESDGLMLGDLLLGSKLLDGKGKLLSGVQKIDLPGRWNYITFDKCSLDKVKRQIKVARAFLKRPRKTIKVETL